jgi:small redox-active disulfide protein 2
MKIKVLGSGCKKCKELFERTQKAVQLVDVTIPVEYVTDVQEIIEMGVMTSPVLAIDGKPVLVGILPEAEKVKQIILDYKYNSSKEVEVKNTKGCGCSCNGNC